MASFSSIRSEAVRAKLIDFVATHPSRSRRPLWAASLVLAGAVAGGGVVTGALAATGLLAPGPAQPSGQPSPELPDTIVAPASVVPGSPVVALVGDSISVTFDSDTTIPLSERPSDVTHARVTITALSTGTVSFGNDRGGNNPSSSWGPEDNIDGGAASAQYDFPLDDSVDTLFLHPTELDGIATLQYVTLIPTEFGVNARGQTFGVTGSDRGEPDLISVVATNGVQGYVLRIDLERVNGATAPEGFTSPEDALTWQEANTNNAPPLTVYESDGITIVGDFQIGG